MSVDLDASVEEWIGYNAQWIWMHNHSFSATQNKYEDESLVTIFSKIWITQQVESMKKKT